ncbi:right-handed parallel beta-helix repeat-containing protein [Streptomyces collinus]|uniref:right-handed parallel beta-helix repeat-containing protein n=1 Tax=Streptomyces collinus TaxID=42684 RepID=UPI00369AABC4
MNVFSSLGGRPFDGSKMSLRVAAVVATAVVSQASLVGIGEGSAAANAGFTQGALAAASNGDGRLEVFGTDGSDSVWHRWQKAEGGWTDWQPFTDGHPMRSVAAESGGNKLMEAFGLDAQQRVWRRAQKAQGGWTDWQVFDDQARLASISVARNKSGRLEVFGANAQGQVWHRWQTSVGGGWSQWSQFTDGPMRSVAAETNDDGRVELFALDKDGGVFHRWQERPDAVSPDNAGWSSWDRLDGTLSSLSVARNKDQTDGRLELFGTNAQGKVWHRWQNQANATSHEKWSLWAPFDGSLSSVAAETNADGRVELFGVNPEGKVWNRWQVPKGDWTNWADLGELITTVAVTSDCDQKPNSPCIDDFIKAISTPYAVVRIPGHLKLNLSGHESIQIAEGVRIIGERTDSDPRGPLIFTDDEPESLFSIGNSDPDAPRTADNVRISGIQLRGGAPDDPFKNMGDWDSSAISIWASKNVQIDHSEISKWDIAIGATDKFRDNMNINNGVRVSDNYIHDNQHPTKDGLLDSSGHGAGYGVVVSYGAYATVERNVFDKNRHAIAAGGQEGTGYRALRNLIINPGLESRYPVYGVTHSQNFDVHGSDCNYYCGLAGEEFDIQYNSFVKDGGQGVYLRGTPSIRMNVANNIFAHSSGDAIKHSTESGLKSQGNLFGLSRFGETFTSHGCDFDKDGTVDPLLATGVTWWYQSTYSGTWTYLTTSTKIKSNITAADLAGPECKKV